MAVRHQSHTKLGQVLATAVCGNDILSSALYVSGIAAIFAGTYAPLVLLSIAGVLFLYRTVYREVVEALPINGGAYNALLNSTLKPSAAMAGVMTILSYVATAVISAKTAVEYLFYFLKQELPRVGYGTFAERMDLLVIPVVIAILFGFAVLVISGVKDSAKVAAGIFFLHIASLTAFVVVAALYIMKSGGAVAAANALATTTILSHNGGLWPTLFLAFSACLLGVSGFESSANFVEEQEPGVFRKTLRNMTIGVMVFNPLIAYVTLKILPLPNIVMAKDFVLAEVALTIGGSLLLGLIAIDAFLVLCGAVLTSYVGVSGLAQRMSLDGCLPGFLSKGSSKNSRVAIIFSFFALCVSILLMTHGELLSLAGVYTISFLGVMSLFAIGNLILRKTRDELKRPYKAPLVFVIIALLATISGLIGNIAIDRRNATFFLMYFIPAMVLVFSIIFQKDLYENLSSIFKSWGPIGAFFRRKFFIASRERVYVFVHRTEALFRILQYINNNEGAHNVTIVHCADLGHADHQTERKKEIEEILPFIRKAGVFPHLNIEFEYISKPFGPEAINYFAHEHSVSNNKIFIGSIHESHDFEYSDLGGVRIIL